MVGMISDALRNQHIGTSVGNDERIPNDSQKGPDEATAAYLKLLENANTELYPGCKNFTSLSFIVRLLHMKVLHKLTNKTIDKFLAFFHEAFPEALNLPNSYYEAQNITDDLGFTYKTWDVCPRSCMLFRNEHANLDACVVCGESRWKVTITRSKTGKKRGKKRAAKQMRKHLEFLKSKMPRADDHQIQREHFETFHAWFKDHVQLMLRTSNATFSEEIHKLAIGPHTIARRFSGYVINGFRFRVKSIDDNRSTQNNGVALKANTNVMRVWYVPDPIEPDWQVVIKMSQRGLYDMHSDDPQVDPYLTQQLEENIGRQDEDIGWVREGEEGDIIDEDV
ncbi:hypothetical protein RHGRI_029546 [Rhododendron griersonianum]|uniref:Transposase n=1 Tax=Rhododendron griersonianum TaxID=479676 RepID=A0AAV6IJV6_9ERIC|nr:hypothetical protein RHGRI_029546 [Rhododendron griersonianum]